MIRATFRVTASTWFRQAETRTGTFDEKTSVNRDFPGRGRVSRIRRSCRRQVCFRGNRQAFLTELQTYLDNSALVALTKRIGPHKFYLYENADALIEAAPSIGLPDSMTIDFLKKMRGIYAQPRNKRVPPFLIFVQDKMIATGSPEIRQRTVAHELMHALDFEVLHASSSADFKAAYDKDVAGLKKFTDEEVGDKDRKRTADITKAFEHYLSAPKEAWAEVGARIIFPHSNKKNTENFERIFSNMFVFVRAKLHEERI